MRRLLAIAVALVALVALLVEVRYAPSTPRGLDAPGDTFSAERARHVQELLVGDGASRWVGTEGNRRGRDVLAAELERAGWQVETQQAAACSNHGMCARVSNLVARLEGTDPALPGVLLSAHHDSVLAGPGASDDGVGTAAVVETARALAAGARPRRTIIVLLTDGEEAGLLGADAFVRDHPLAKTVRMTVNVDARGSHGPSQMFETSAGNAWLVALLAAKLPRPVTTSLFYEVYRRMPNDTDFSLTKTIASGVNFANTAGIEHYHTPLDALATADRGTLQHHGDHVLAMARAFADGDGAGGKPGDRDAVWFDVLALGIVSWPASWSMLLAVLALASIAAQTVRTRAFDRGLAVFPVMLLAGGLAAALAGWLVRVLGAVPTPWVAHPNAGRVAIECAGALAAIAAGRALATRGASPRALGSGVWLGWAALGVASAALAPGASYLFLVPALIAAAVGIITRSRVDRTYLLIVPAVAASVLVLAVRVGLYEALGFAVAPLLGLPVILVATTLAPLLGDLPGKPLLAGGAVVVAALAAAVAAPKFSPAHPQRVNVVYRQDSTEARVFVDASWGPMAWGGAPPSMLDALGNGPRQELAALPWSPRATSIALASLELPAPAAEVLSTKTSSGNHLVRARVTSPRGAGTLALFFPGAAERAVDVKVEGRFAFPRAVTGGTLVDLLGVPPEGLIVEIGARGEPAIACVLLDRSPGVPPGSKAEVVVRARPASATASQDGDVTVVTRSLSL